MKRRSLTLAERIAVHTANGMTRQQALTTIIAEGKFDVLMRAAARRDAAMRAAESRRTRRSTP